MSEWNNVYLFHGPDTHAMRLKLTAWLKRFAASADLDFDKSDIDASLSPLESVINALHMVPLFGSKRLVIIRHACGVPSAAQARLLEALQNITPDMVVLFVEEGALPAKSELANALLQHAHNLEFATPTTASLRRRVNQWFEEKAVAIEPRAVEELIIRIGADFVRLPHELEKLRLSANNAPLSVVHVQELVSQPLESRIFKLSDHLFAEKQAEAVALLIDELEYGTAPLQIIGLLQSQVRRLVILKDAENRRIPAGAMQQFKSTKPFVMQNLQRQIKPYSLERLSNWWLKLCLADMRVKQGEEPLPVLLGLLTI